MSDIFSFNFSFVGIAIFLMGSCFRILIMIQRANCRYFDTQEYVVPKINYSAIKEPPVLAHAKRNPRQSSGV
jgi:hypothetical protein